jgi:predicted RNA-binding protein (virulence factor B family)
MKLEIGRLHTLRVNRFTEFGAYLAFNDREILIPLKYIPEDTRVNSELEVFVYRDSEDRLIAATSRPLAMVGDFAFLKVKEVTSFGAFLDWGLEKDLFSPFREQLLKMEAGKSYVVAITMDKLTERIIASAKINKYLDHEIGPDTFRFNEPVELLIARFTDLGANVIINNRYPGLIYRNEIFEDLHIGDRLTGYIKKVREGGKVDVSLQKQGAAGIDDNSQFLLEELKANKGKLDLTDNSSPEEIYARLGISKKLFKKALGGLYKQKMVKITEDGIELIP